MTIELLFQGETAGTITAGADLTTDNPARLQSIIDYYKEVNPGASPEAILWKMLERMKPGRQWEARGVGQVDTPDPKTAA